MNTQKLSSARIGYHTFVFFCVSLAPLLMLILLASATPLLAQSDAPSIIGFLVLVYSLVSLAISFALATLSHAHATFSLEKGSLTFSQGMLGSQTQLVPFEKVRATQFGQNLLQRLFGVGTLTFDLGEGSATFHEVDQPSAQLILSALKK